MRNLSNEFIESVQNKWGNPLEVAKVGMEEMFRHPRVGFDYKKQNECALAIGILAGEMKDRSSEEFIERFRDEIFDYE